MRKNVIIYILILISVNCFATRIQLTNQASWGAYYTANVNFPYTLGDTLVINNVNGLVTIGLQDFHGTYDKPVVIINEGSDSITTLPPISLVNCWYVKLTGSGQSGWYGFFSPSSSTAINITGKSKNIEVERIRIFNCTYFVVAKQDPSCDTTLQYPNWTMDSITVHDIYAKGASQDGFYFGNTAPDGSRPVCGGFPIPMRLANAKIYNCIVDSCGRTGIQISGSFGNNEVYNCAVTRTGYEINQTQGAGILVGGSVTNAYYHHNYTRYTYQNGIGMGANGLAIAEYNNIDSAGMIPIDNYDKLVLTNTDTAYAYLKSGGTAFDPPNPSLKIIASVTRQSGAVGGTIYIIASSDGINWTKITSDYIITNVAYQKNTFDITTSTYDRFKVVYKQTSTGVGYYRSIVWNDWYPLSLTVGRNIVYPVDDYTQQGTTIIRNNILGMTDDSNFGYNNGRNITVSDPNDVWSWVSTSLICNNTKQDGSPASMLLPSSGFNYSTNCTYVSPVVTTGANQTIYYPDTSTIISGSATVGGAVIISYLWTQVSGASCNIVSSSLNSTSVNGLTSGVYVFRLTATDNTGATAYDDITINVSSSPPTFNYYRSITIDHTKVYNSDQTNFPVLFSCTCSYLKTTTNGGKVYNSSGYDIAFTSDSTGTTKLNWEVESYTPTTGDFTAWVKVPTVSTNSDTKIYIHYGNANIVTIQSSIPNTWSNSFSGVYHIADSTTAGNDALGVNNGTNTGVTTTVGKIGGAGTFASGSNISISSLLSSPSSITVSGWVNLTTAGASGSNIISLGDHVSMLLGLSGAGSAAFYFTGSTWPVTSGGSSLTNTGWHYLAYTVTANNQKLYLDGSLLASSTNSGAISYAVLGSSTKIGIHGNGSGNYNFGGKLDEIRVASAIRSLDWLKTEYNNQNDPSTFYSVGAEVVGSLPAFPGFKRTTPGRRVKSIYQ